MSRNQANMDTVVKDGLDLSIDEQQGNHQDNVGGGGNTDDSDITSTNDESINDQTAKTGGDDDDKHKANDAPPVNNDDSRIRTKEEGRPQNGHTHNSKAGEQPKEEEQLHACNHCGIAFVDYMMHAVHMGYHGFNDVFTCNMCGTKCDNARSFFLHMVQNPHA